MIDFGPDTELNPFEVDGRAGTGLGFLHQNAGEVTMRPFRVAIAISIAGLVQVGLTAAPTTQDELRAALQRRFETVTPDIGELLPDIELYDADGDTVKLREMVRSGRYTVLVLGCLT
jgi:hypothetical protein